MTRCEAGTKPAQSIPGHEHPAAIAAHHRQLNDFPTVHGRLGLVPPVLPMPPRRQAAPWPSRLTAGGSEKSPLPWPRFSWLVGGRCLRLLLVAQQRFPIPFVQRYTSGNPSPKFVHRCRSSTHEQTAQTSRIPATTTLFFPADTSYTVDYRQRQALVKQRPSDNVTRLSLRVPFRNSSTSGALAMKGWLSQLRARVYLAAWSVTSMISKHQVPRRGRPQGCTQDLILHLRGDGRVSYTRTDLRLSRTSITRFISICVSSSIRLRLHRGRTRSRPNRALPPAPRSKGTQGWIPALPHRRPPPRRRAFALHLRQHLGHRLYRHTLLAVQVRLAHRQPPSHFTHPASLQKLKFQDVVENRLRRRHLALPNGAQALDGLLQHGPQPLQHVVVVFLSGTFHHPQPEQGSDSAWDRPSSG